MPFQWDHCKIKLLLNYILLTVLNWVKVGTPVLKLLVETLVRSNTPNDVWIKLIISHKYFKFVLHVLILLNISDSTLQHCSQSENKKGDPIPERTGYLFFPNISSWKEGHGITLSSWHVFETAYSRALSGITTVKTSNASREVGFGKSESHVQEAVWEQSARGHVTGSRLLGSRAAVLVWLLLWVLVLSNERMKRLSL